MESVTADTRDVLALRRSTRTRNAPLHYDDSSRTPAESHFTSNTKAKKCDNLCGHFEENYQKDLGA
jgi:hypothetical protein